MTFVVRRALFNGAVWLLAAAIRAGLWLLPFATVRRLVRRAAPRTGSPRPSTGRSPAELARAVRGASRFVPSASCLTQALAMEVLLLRAGHQPRLRIGLARDAGRLQAHAWVENMGTVVIGGEELDRFVPLPAVEKA